MARCVALLAALVLLCGTATAFAQNPGRAPSIYDKPQMAIFDEGDEVLGDLPSFDGLLVEATTNVRFGTLIKVREDFMPELLKACEDL